MSRPINRVDPRDFDPVAELARAAQRTGLPPAVLDAAAKATGHFVGCTCEQCPADLDPGVDPGNQPVAVPERRDGGHTLERYSLPPVRDIAAEVLASEVVRDDA